ncbi:MAG: LptE family protein [Bdellovibrionales bacterium]|nr:LptE family protein [Bdellovibrionales bacterium]
MKNTNISLFVMNATLPHVPSSSAKSRNCFTMRTCWLSKSWLTGALVSFVFPLLCLLAVTTGGLVGCGYGFRGSESALPPDVERVYIPMAINQSTEAGVDLLLTEALRDEFERYGTLTVVDSSNQADAILDTTIVSIKRERGATASRTDTALQQYTVMTLSAVLRKTTGALLWRNERMKVSKVFGAEGGVVVTSSADFASGNLASGDLANLDSREVSRGQEQQALEDLSAQVAQQIYSAAVIPEF